MAAPAASAANSCDLSALRHYPMQDVLKQRAIPFTLPSTFFRAPGVPPEYSFDYGLDAEGERQAKEALARGLKTVKPLERPVLMLAAIDSWTSSEDGLLNFFILEQGVYLDEVLATLDSEGLNRHAALFRAGRALFGTDYGTQRQRYYRWSDGSGTILDPRSMSH